MDKRYYALLPALILIGLVSLFADKNKASEKGTAKGLIVPPALKDLRKGYKVRIIYFVPSDRTEVHRPLFGSESEAKLSGKD